MAATCALSASSASSPPSSSAKRASPRASVYVHFPWCLAKCPYCDFVSYATPRDAIDHDGYADAVACEIDARADALAAIDPDRPRVVGSVFFGGGTPSLWEPRALGRVLARVKDRFACAADLEVTVECNPTSLDRARAEALVEAGVDRLSIGTQSLRAEQLQFLGRLHDPSGALAAIDAALAAGVPRVSTDLIFGLPDQSPEDARAQALSLASIAHGARRLTHLSCYQLTIEPGTRFGELAKRGRLPMADDGRVAEAFLAIDEALATRGLAHYEVSNYAVPGDEARHNLGYWRGDEYVGVGCAAYGMVRLPRGRGDAPARGVRYRNAVDPKRYVEAARRAAHDRVGDGDHLSITSEPLDADALLRERIMLGLRIAEGIDLDACGADLGVDPWTVDRTRAAARLVARGRLARDGARLRIPRDAWLWTDDTAAALF